MNLNFIFRGAVSFHPSVGTQNQPNPWNCFLFYPFGEIKRPSKLSSQQSILCEYKQTWQLLVKIKSDPVYNPGHNMKESCFFFLSFYHNKIHPVTNYKAIKNKINKTRQHKTKIFLTIKTTTTTTTKRDEITRPRTPSLFILNGYQSIIWSIGCHFFNNLGLLELVNSFFISLISFIVIFKLSKFNCLVFMAL